LKQIPARWGVNDQYLSKKPFNAVTPRVKQLIEKMELTVPFKPFPWKPKKL